MGGHISSTAPVLADSPPEIPPPTTLPPVDEGADSARLPTNQDMVETLAQFEAEENHELEVLEGPAATQEREASQDLYSGIAPSQAEQLLNSQFGGELQALNAEPARFLSSAELDRPIGETSAVVTSEGHKQLLEGTVPLLAPNEEGQLTKVNLSLEEHAGAYEPVNPVVAVSIPGFASESVEVGNGGMEISQAGAEENSTAQPFGDMNVFYPEVATDTDLLVSPVSTGVELFDQLRSEGSPETLRFSVQLPEGANLVPASGGGAEILSGEGSKIAEVPAPTAEDAQGRELPVEMQVDGDSLVLHVDLEGEIAYPALVDPELKEEWYFHNWYNGENLQALSNGAWHWNTSEGASSSYVYGSASCIYSCWGSGRGLYMDTPNGNLPANRWGQWSYSAPNSETYLANAWVSPFFRDNHGNCSQSQYGQPYDYDGMWNESSWNRILYNQANDQGWSDIESWGRAFIIGMGTSSGISIPCWRDVMGGGVAIWLEDWSRPTLTTSSSGQWMDTSPIRLNVSAYDSGLGVRKFKATATNSGGHQEEWWTNNSCTGLYEAPCPHTWNLGEGSQPQLSYSPSQLPEGIDKLSVTAYDAIEKPSFTTNEMTIRIDHAPPAITFGGTLAEQAKLGSELPSYTVLVEARDGDPTSQSPATTRSGVTNMRIEVDGQLVTAPFTPSCAGEPNCGALQELEVPAATMTAGPHVLKVTATDAYGHVGVKELNFSTGDKVPPTVSFTGGPAEEPSMAAYTSTFGTSGSGSGQLSRPGDVAVDANGNVWVADETNNRIDKFNERGEYVGKLETGNVQLSCPAGVALAPNGYLWVLQKCNDQVAEFTPQGQLERKFGSAGSGNGQFAGGGPEGIGVDAKGNVWVSDTYGARVEEFNEKGEFIRAVGSRGSAPGQLVEPCGIDFDSKGNVYVADWVNNRIEKYNEKGEYLAQFGVQGSNPGQLLRPFGVDVDGSGHVWVVDTGNSRVEEFSEGGEYLGKFGSAGTGVGQFSFSYPAGIEVDSSGRIWAADTNNNRIEKWRLTSKSTPSYVSAFGSVGSGNGQLNRPADVAVDSHGNIWVADKNNNRIEEFSSNGEYMAKFGSSGSGNGQLSCPTGVTIDAKGNFWVSDKCNNRVEEFNEKGEYMAKFGSSGSGNGQFNGPEGIGVDAKGNVWVSDTYNARLEEFNEKGVFIRAVGSRGSAPGQLIEPCGIDFDATGDVLVADWSNNRIEKYNEKGEYLTQFGIEGTGPGQLRQPFGLDVDSRGDVWVVDTGNSRVEEFSEGGEYLGKFGSAGSGEGQFSFSYPAGIDVDAANRLWIADINNSRIQKWLAPIGGTGAFVEPVNVTAVDRGWGATSLTTSLKDPSGHETQLSLSTQTCPKGACSLTAILNDIELSGWPAGIYTLTGVAKDGLGHVGTGSRSFGLDPNPPEISLSGKLAERDGQPLNASTGELTIKASDTGLPESGVKTINVERENQRVATYRSNCSVDCHEASMSYRYNATRDGAERSIQASVEESKTVTTIQDVSCAASSNCFAVGYKNRLGSGVVSRVIEHWDGVEWTAQSSPGPPGGVLPSYSHLEGVTCSSASNCTAVGYYKISGGSYSTFAEQWNGSTWSLMSTPNPEGLWSAYLYSVSCGTASDCWAVGKAAPKPTEEAEGKKPAALLEHWNGSAWSIYSLAEAPSQLTSVSCASASLCFVLAGQEGLSVEKWNGSTWTSQTVAAPPGVKSTFKDVACAPEAVCTAVGAYSSNGHEAPLVERWSGSQWSVQSPVDPLGVIEGVTASGFEAVSCPTASACTAVGVRNTSGETLPLVEGWDSVEWALQPAAIPSGTSNAVLSEVGCSASFACTAIGANNPAGTAKPLVERESPGKGHQSLGVEAVDKFGNAETKDITVDVSEEHQVTPSCSHKVTSTKPEGAVSSGEAIAAVKGPVSNALAPSEATVNAANEKEVDPSYAPPNPNLESVGNLAKVETAVSPEGGVTLKGIACMTPAATTSAATEATVVNGDAAIFANTAPETDTVIRPSVGGMTMVQSLRGSKAPTTLSWHLTVNPGEKAVRLPSGAVAITRAGSAGEAEGELPELSKPEGFETPRALNSAEVQLEANQYQLAHAEAETSEEVLAVIANPWVILRQESIVPLKMEVQPDVEIPTEYTVTTTLPPFEPNFTPEAVVDEATASAVVNGRCLEGSPCGWFDVESAARYAEYWGNEAHPRNPYYHDFGDDNCTNFVSQVLARGGMSYMRAFEHGDGSWWYRPALQPKGTYDYTESWTVADILPRHLWQYGLAVIDSSNQPSGWTAGDILAEDWYATNGKGDFNHLQFVVGTHTTASGAREPLIANESSAGSNYSHLPWINVKEHIEAAEGSEWNRVPLAVKHTVAELSAKVHDPANLYGPGGVFSG